MSLFVALADWRVAPGRQAGRSVCHLDTHGYSVVVLTMALSAPDAPPAGLCAPEGSTVMAGSDPGILCAYAGPDPMSVTAVVAASGTAVGVRVTGPDAAEKAEALTLHARAHL